MADQSALAYALRKNCATHGIHFPISHAHQLIAAALGHGTLAALQASKDASELATAAFLIIDTVRLEERASDLGLPANATQLLAEAVDAVLDENVPATVFSHVSSFVEALQAFVDDEGLKDDEVAGELAMTNGSLDEIYLPLYLEESLDLDDAEDISYEIDGHVSVDQDPDKAYWGHMVDVEATLTVIRLGKRLFAEADLHVTRAKLRWFNEAADAAEADVGEMT